MSFINLNLSVDKIAVLDIETTGFDHQKDCILEIGIVELDLKTGKRKILYDSLVKEKKFSYKHANSWIFKNSNLRYDNILHAMPLDVDTLQKIFNNYYVTAYNINFDISFLKARGLKFPYLADCPMKLMSTICKIPKNPFSNNIHHAHKGKYKYPSVKESVRYILNDSVYIEEHRAVKDAMDEAIIICHLYNLGHYRYVEVE